MQRPLPLLKMWYLSTGRLTNFQSDHHCVSAELTKSPCRMTTPSFNRSEFTPSPGTSSIRLLFTLTMWYQTVVSMFIGASSHKKLVLFAGFGLAVDPPARTLGDRALR